MSNHRLSSGTILGAIALWTCLASSANAATLNVSGGILLGASNVDVGGSPYNVTFVDGVCSALFSGCDAPGDFTFTTQAAALLASQALLDQVFLDIGFDYFDGNPSLTSGCGDLSFCFAITPYGVNAFNVSAAFAQNFQGNPDATLATVIPANSDLAIDNTVVYALWSPVPEAGTSVLLAVGLIAIATRRRR